MPLEAVQGTLDTTAQFIMALKKLNGVSYCDGWNFNSALMHLLEQYSAFVSLAAKRILPRVLSASIGWQSAIVHFTSGQENGGDHLYCECVHPRAGSAILVLSLSSARYREVRFRVP